MHIKDTPGEVNHEEKHFFFLNNSCKKLRRKVKFVQFFNKHDFFLFNFKLYDLTYITKF
jgi:hypothetical protein